MYRNGGTRQLYSENIPDFESQWRRLATFTRLVKLCMRDTSRSEVIDFCYPYESMTFIYRFTS